MLGGADQRVHTSATIRIGFRECTRSTVWFRSGIFPMMAYGEPSTMETIMNLTESYAVADTFVSGLGEVEDIGGGCFRFTFYSRSTHDGREEWQVAARIIMPATAVPNAMGLTARTTHICVCEANRQKTN